MTASRPITLTLDRDDVGALNDALYTLINDPESDEEDLAGYQTLRDDILRQLNEQIGQTQMEMPR